METVEHHEPAPERAQRASGREADDAGSVDGCPRGLKTGPLWGPPRTVEHHEPAPERAQRASGREADEAGSVYGRLRGLKSKGPRMREGPLTLPGLEPGIAA